MFVENNRVLTLTIIFSYDGFLFLFFFCFILCFLFISKLFFNVSNVLLQIGEEYEDNHLPLHLGWKTVRESDCGSQVKV